MDDLVSVSFSRFGDQGQSSQPNSHSSVVNGLRKKLQDTMALFNDLRQKIRFEYRETVQRRYYKVTGENPDERVLDQLIETGESESFLQKTIEQQGRGHVMDTITEIQERLDTVKEIEKNLREMQQVFMDLADLAQSRGEQLDDIENQLNRASSFVRRGTQQLEDARKHKKSSRKWTYVVILLLIIILIIVVSVRPWK